MQWRTHGFGGVQLLLLDVLKFHEPMQHGVDDPVAAHTQPNHRGDFSRTHTHIPTHTHTYTHTQTHAHSHTCTQIQPKIQKKNDCLSRFQKTQLTERSQVRKTSHQTSTYGGAKRMDIAAEVGEVCACLLGESLWGRRVLGHKTCHIMI